jgi:SAM-dependent methyltransferase
MASWVSHLPDGIGGLAVTGLGLNAAELERNAGLSARVVHDLNADARLPFADGAFDGAVCTASVEYLIDPLAVFRELARVLKPGAPLVVTFSDRWFPTKAIALWGELHAFERMALVIDYFRKSGGFTGLATESIRGLPRPADDKYAGQLPYADPVFAVWGRRTA